MQRQGTLKWCVLLFLILTYACGGDMRKGRITQQKNKSHRKAEALNGLFPDRNCFRQDSLSTKEDNLDETLPDSVLLSPDSLSANKIWTYHYADGAFPCDPDGGCVIKGFWADGKGRFYIVGGEPLRLACYRGNKQEYSRVISHAICNSCLLRMRGDSLWFVEDNEHSFLRIHKSGIGEIVRHPIPMAKTDSIMFGQLNEDTYVLSIKDLAGAINAQTYEENNSWMRSSKFAYPASLLRSVNYSKLFSMYDPYKEWDAPFTPYGYMGKIGKWKVYLSVREYNEAFVALQREGEDNVNIFPVKGLPPVAAIGVTDDMQGPYHNPNLDNLINGTMYLSGYDLESKRFQIHEFDIAALCRRLERRE